MARPRAAGGPARRPNRQGARAPGPPARVSPARQAAFWALTEVGSTSVHSDELLRSPRFAALSDADRGLGTVLVLGTLRWQIALDGRLRALLDRPDDPLPLPVLLAFRLGAFQLLHLTRVPPHAALHESVELVRAAGHPGAAGLVNALLRKLAAAAAPRQPIAETLAGVALRLGHPAWLVERWASRYGRAVATHLCEHDQAEPPPPSLFPQIRLAEPTMSAAEPAPSSVRELAPPRMDDGSRLVAELAAAAHPQPRRIWDCCAAPGGKTLVLLDRHPGAALLATDISPRRLRALTARLGHVASGSQAVTELADAARPNPKLGLFDLILCDAPCSGTGTLARNPEIRHRLQAAELTRQADRQRALLANALRHLAPGGALLYSTCSLEPEENEDILDAVLSSAEHAREVIREDVRPLLTRLGVPGLDALASDGVLRTLPGANFAGDGFFAALLRKSAP